MPQNPEHRPEAEPPGVQQRIAGRPRLQHRGESGRRRDQAAARGPQVAQGDNVVGVVGKPDRGMDDQRLPPQSP
jgi:hypothetical protein